MHTCKYVCVGHKYLPALFAEFTQLEQCNKFRKLNLLTALEIWLKTTNTKIIQVNGQRKYGGPPEVWDGPTPGSRCEVFISQIPRDVYEDLLIPLFSSVGPLWEFRLMMNFSGQNRGFAYAKYGSSAVATEAIRLLHGHMLEPGFCLSVRRSTEKRHLCIGDLPAVKLLSCFQVLRRLADGVERVSLKAGPDIDGVTAIVAFSSHHTAAMAKKMLVEAFKKQFSLNISIKWQSTVKLSPDEALPPRKPSKGLLLSPPRPPRYSLKSPQPSVLPPQHRHPPCSSAFSPGNVVFPASPVMLLRKMCEANGAGQPLYEMHYSHAGPDGFLYLTYTVYIPGTIMPLKGLVTVLPGPSATTMMEEAQQATAQQVLQRLYNNQFTL
uniref:DND microRNA-mediated repression inhibitor 1 n=1 Tax=Mastacembelus armatus TaxID=205130 RepID=A0A7N8YE00_9TELE